MVTLLQVMSTILKLDLMMICCTTSCSDWALFSAVCKIKIAIFCKSVKGAELHTNYFRLKTLKAVTFAEVIFTEDQGVSSEPRVGGAYFFFL